MDIRTATLLCAFCLPQAALAAQTESAPVAQAGEEPEEIIVTGQRRRFELRVEMLTAEKHVYDVFNMFNDDKRFEIECSIHKKTGTTLKTQFCVPAFKREALAAEGRDYLEAYRAFIDPHHKDAEPFVTAAPSAGLIRAGQIEYQRKMQQLARDQPEFLRALIRYTEMKAEYEAATSMSGEPEENE